MLHARATRCHTHLQAPLVVPPDIGCKNFWALRLINMQQLESRTAAVTMAVIRAVVMPAFWPVSVADNLKGLPVACDVLSSVHSCGCTHEHRWQADNKHCTCAVHRPPVAFAAPLAHVVAL